MGIYLNPGNGAFREAVQREIYVDKSLLIEKLWVNVKRINKYVCVSRPRRFGKSTDANMLAAYFSKGCDSHDIFDQLKIAKCGMYEEQMNQYDVIHLNIQEFLSQAHNVEAMIARINQKVVKDLKKAYPDICDEDNLIDSLRELYAEKGNGVIFVVDEWDCIFREFKEDKESQERYLDYLRLVFKDKAYVKMVYMTGILPIKKYGTHSALNMFDEVSMIDADEYAEFMGITDAEVKDLCRKYEIDYAMMKEWYNGYQMKDGISTYSPRSVTASILKKSFSNYWSQTETYDALKVYIDLNFDGLKDVVIDLLNGNTADVDVLAFQNDMSTFASKDDVFTLLIHFGYLGYIWDEHKIYIPNNEVKDVFITSIKNSNWDYITKVFQNANQLLEATWNGQEKRVAEFIENSHYETSILQYNDENALAYTVNLAYITAKQYYTIVRELPAGKGFADIVFIPKKNSNKPAMIVELKYDKEAESGIRQIKNKKYYPGLRDYLGNLLLVAIIYDKLTKKHSCVIETYEKSNII